MDLAYYPGCSLYQSAKLYNHQTKLVFGILGLHLKELEDWSCCGATSAGKINDFMAYQNFLSVIFRLDSNFWDVKSYNMVPGFSPQLQSAVASVLF